jgi:DNA processing protein
VTGAGDDRYARAALSSLAEPGDLVLGAMLRSASPAEVLALTRSGDDLLPGLPGLDPGMVSRAMSRWRARLAGVPSPGRLAMWEGGDVRLVCPGDPEWPTQLDDLGDARPLLLWLRGATDLRFACLRSVSIVGARAATGYGTHVAGELAADLAGSGWAIVSGGAYGIDAAAHRGALAVGGCTVAVLASGLSFGYPRGHQDLFDMICDGGLLVSERLPDQAPTRPGFLVRNRMIAALSRGTAVVEAALRSGALNTARQAGELRRPVMAVPGPVTSDLSAGCHDLIRDGRATLVTGACDVAELLSPLGEEGDRDLAGNPVGLGHRSAAVPPGVIDPVTASVLNVVPARAGRGPATIATLAGVNLDTAFRCLGLLAAAGYVERCDQGWRRRRGSKAKGTTACSP